jgi:hypothetical protein
MAKWFLRAGVILSVSLLCGYLPLKFGNDFFSVIYTVIGIMFPVALSQIMAFSFGDIENDRFIERYRGQLSRVRNTFVVLFSLATLVFLLKGYGSTFCFKWFKFNIPSLFGVYLLFCLVYFIRNFISLARLKDEIEDEVRKNKFHTTED